MSTPTPPLAATSDTARPRSPADVRPTVLQALATFLGGLAVAAGSCAGFLGTLNFNHDSPVNMAFAIGFMLSLAVAGVGFCLIVIRQVMVMRLRRSNVVSVPSGQGPTRSAAGPVAGTPAPVTDRGSAWMALVAAAVMLAAAVGFVVLLTVVDPNPVALVFLVLAAGSAVASIVLFVIAGVRYSRGR
jgi:hypothetical protein